MMLLFRLLAVFCVLVLIRPHSLSAQFAFSADATFSTRYVWRGITRTTKPVVQPSALIAWVPAGWTVTTGVWASVEPFHPAADDLTDARDAGFGEIDYWIEAHTRFRGLDVRFGHIWYDPRGERITVGPGIVETAELYAGLLLLPSRLGGLGANVYWDYDEVDGVFVTLEAFRHVPLVQAGDWIFTITPKAEAGISAGEAFDNSSGAAGYYVDDGLAYVNTMLGLFAQQQTWSTYIAGTVQYNGDRATRLTRPGGDSRKSKAWFELGVSYRSGTRPRQR